MTTDKKSCSGRLKSVMGNCLRSAEIFHEGKWYCWQHSPLRAEEAAKKAKEDRQASNAEIERQWQANRQRKDLLKQAGIKDISDDDLKTIISLGGIHVIIARCSKENELSVLRSKAIEAVNECTELLLK